MIRGEAWRNSRRCRGRKEKGRERQGKKV